MKITVTESMFVEEFARMNRRENFTRPALQTLFAYLDQLDEEIGEETELDVIDICCTWQEATVEELREMYSEASDQEDPIDWLRTQTLVLNVHEDRVVFIAF